MGTMLTLFEGLRITINFETIPMVFFTAFALCNHAASAWFKRFAVFHDRIRYAAQPIHDGTDDFAFAVPFAVQSGLNPG